MCTEWKWDWGEAVENGVALATVMILLLLLVACLPSEATVTCHYCYEPDSPVCVSNSTCRGDMCVIHRPARNPKRIEQYCVHGFSDDVLGCWKHENGDVECSCKENKCNSWAAMKHVKATLLPQIRCSELSNGYYPPYEWDEHPATAVNCTATAYCESRVEEMPDSSPLHRVWQGCQYLFAFPVAGSMIGELVPRMNACYKWTFEHNYGYNEYGCRCNYTGCNDDYMPFPVADGIVECYRSYSDGWNLNTDEAYKNENLTCRGDFCVIYKFASDRDNRFASHWADPMENGNYTYQKGCVSANQTGEAIIPGMYQYNMAKAYYFLCDKDFCNADMATMLQSFGRDQMSSDDVIKTTSPSVTVVDASTAKSKKTTMSRTTTVQTTTDSTTTENTITASSPNPTTDMEMLDSATDATTLATDTTTKYTCRGLHHSFIALIIFAQLFSMNQ